MLDKTQISTLNTDHIIDWQVGSHDHHHSGIWFQPQDTTGKGLNAIKLKFLKSSPKKSRYLRGSAPCQGSFASPYPSPSLWTASQDSTRTGFGEMRWFSVTICCTFWIPILDQKVTHKKKERLSEAKAAIKKKMEEREEEEDEKLIALWSWNQPINKKRKNGMFFMYVSVASLHL